MKRLRHKTIILLISMFMPLCGLVAQSPEETFRQANNYYNESRYDTALILYKSIVNQGLESPVLFYNMGNAYYKLNNYPLSILYYEKALKLDPNSEEIIENLSLANFHTKDKIDPVPEIVFKKWWKSFGNWFSADEWAAISIIFFLGLLTALYFYFRARTKAVKKLSFFAGLTLIVLNVIIFTVSAQKYKYVTEKGEGVIINSTINVKSSPSSSSVDLFVLHEGAKVEIMDEADNWNKIKIANGSVGWLPSESIIKY